MNLLFFTPDFKPMSGGVAEHTHQYANYFAGRDHSVTVVAPRVEGSREFDAGQPYEVVRVRQRPKPFGYLFFLAVLVGVLRRERVDWVYCPVWYPLALFASAVSPFTSARLAIGAHGWEVIHEGRTLSERLQGKGPTLQRPVFRAADVVVAVSEWTREAVLRTVPDGVDVRVVNNGVDVAEFEDARPLETVGGVDVRDRNVLLTVSRLAPRKGHDVLIEALPSITEEHPDTVYLVAGDGGRRSELESLARRVGVEDHVVFLGYVPDEDLPDLYATADQFVMPNRREGNSVEGFGIVFLEANATGTPVVGGDSGGAPDAVADGVTGRLVDPYDADAVAEAVTELLSDRETLARMGRSGYERVRSEFDWERAGRELEEVLFSVR